ncbi:hypothetical protein BC936DRAFT_144624 [Jimgerdemannia flammicorona]|uniref:Uncharacterized protein n=1 Tax=Jimgerdemannia flammicorona TaxID=994334 RepID=A0A433DC44_9FUNG|nr:hypothetical protein BC936DRAFT_144624 [Jimgerdemannia flammicorona]
MITCKTIRATCHIVVDGKAATFKKSDRGTHGDNGASGCIPASAKNLCRKCTQSSTLTHPKTGQCAKFSTAP